MNSSGFEITCSYDHLMKKIEGEAVKPSILMDHEQHAHTITHKITSHLEEDISDLAFHRLEMIAQECERHVDWDEHQKLIRLAGEVVENFEHIHYRRGFFAKVFHRIMVTLNLRHSEQEIRIMHRAIRAPALGGKIATVQAADLIKAHRNPAISSEAYDQVALSGIYFESKLKELLTQHAEKIKTLKEPHLAIFKAHLKEQAVKEVYRQELPKRIQEGCYNPAVIPLEMEMLLGPVLKISRTKFTKENLPQWFAAETQRYAKHLTAHQLNYIQKDVTETMLLYLKAYPDKTPRNAFVMGRDLIRLAVYQEIFDKASFTGSDHGSKHIHHNIENADALHHAMEYRVDYSDKDMLIERLIHFYHDVGYTVGLSGKSFSCCKDHPLIGAKLIEENREYFEYYLDKDAADILWNGVLLHAIAMPNLTPDQLVGGMFPAMVRAVTSISDACAVTFDRKTQEFWEQPTTLIALARLRLFLTKYPQYVAKLAPLGKGEWELLDRENPLDVLAHDVFQNTKRILLKAVDNYDVLPEKKALFRQAIFQQFNSFTTATTLGQLGGMLTGVSSFKNEDIGEGLPKFYPQFDLAPSIIYGTLHDLFGADIAQASFKKLVDEFSGDLNMLAKEINAVAKKIDLGGGVVHKIVKTGNARFKIHRHAAIDPTNKHLHEMQHSLQRVIEKVDSVVRSQYMSLAEKTQVLQNLQAFRQGKFIGCTTFSDFISEHILPHLSIYQSVEAVKDINLLTKAVKADVFLEINRTDNAWTKIFKLLEKPQFNAVCKEVESFKSNIEKIKSSLREKKGQATLIEQRIALMAAVQKTGNIDLAQFEKQLDEVVHLLLENASAFAAAEKKFSMIENAVKLALISEEEYHFMRGKRTAIKKVECLTQLCTMKDE